MSLSALVGMLLLSAVARAPAAPSPEDLRAYESARARTGRDAGAQVKLALWCERHGLAAERVKHLALAVILDPKNSAARGLLGLVQHGGKWESPDAIGRRVQADEALAAKLAKYNARRDELDRQVRRSTPAEAAQAHVNLGSWCETNGLPAEATAHFTTAVVLDPYRDTTWKRLGYLKHSGRWMTLEEADEARREALLQRKADRHWEPLLKQWRTWLAGTTHHGEAQSSLAGVDDPRAVPSIVRVFCVEGESNQRVALELLSRLVTSESTRELARLAVWGASGSIRNAAIQVLRSRDPNDFVGRLIGLIHDPIRYQIEPLRGPMSTGALAIETNQFRMLRTYTAPPLFQLSNQFWGYIDYRADGLPIPVRGAEMAYLASYSSPKKAETLAKIEARTNQLLAVAQWKIELTQQRLQADVRMIETANIEAITLKERIVPVLKEVAGAPELEGEDAWHSWWYDRLGLKYERRPPITVVVDATPPQPPPPTVYSCFAAGTPVRTREGFRPIETLRVGDHVLSQDTTTGALGFEPVLVVHHNAPVETLRIAFGNGETLSSSVYHRFWRAGRGWAMARELKPGDEVRTLGGLTRVASVSGGPTVPVFNLDVAGSRTFFVGEQDALVHDNSLPEPGSTPFDAEPELAAEALTAR